MDRKQFRLQENKKNDLHNQILLNTLDREKRADSRALSRRLYAESRQGSYAKDIYKDPDALQTHHNEIERDVAIAQQIISDRMREDKELINRRLLRETQELQELESRLKAAYTQKELYTQLEAKRAEKIKTELEQQEEGYRLQAVEDAMNKHEEKRRIEAANKKREYREFLQDQMGVKHKQKIEEHKMSLEEKAILDDSLKVAQEIEKREEENRLKKIQELKDEIEEFNRCRKQYMLLEKEKEKEEERKVKEYLEEKFKKDQYHKEMARRKEEQKLKFHEAVVKVMLDAQGKRMEEERINQILLDEDSRQKEEAKLKAEYEKEIHTRQQLKEVFGRQVEEKLRRLEEDRKLDYEFCQMLLREQEKNNKRHLQLEEERRTQKVKYGQELKQIVQEREKLRQHDLYRRIDEYQGLIKENKERLKEIDDERIRMLKQHASRLLGYLPKGIIQNSDLPHLDPLVQKYFNYSSSSTVDQ